VPLRKGSGFNALSPALPRPNATGTQQATTGAGWRIPTQTLAEVIAEVEAAAERSRRIAQGPDPGDRFVHYRRGEVTFHWIGLHMIEELARHAGDADIPVEQILADPSAPQ